jgi:hypothetical protein
MTVPLVLGIGARDDGLYMKLASFITSGQWLGPYDQFTLAKGAGYPLFLAITAFSGLPLTLSHGLVHVFAFVCVGVAVAWLSGSKTTGALLIIVLALHPIALLPEVNRAVRDELYFALVLITFSGLTIITLVPPHRFVSATAAGTGLAFGWAWLTREEYEWLVLVPVVFAAIAVVTNRVFWKSWVRGLAIAGGFSAVMIAMVATANWKAYGTWSITEFRERNFVGAFGEMQRVGDLTAYVPVPAAARNLIATVSPTFATLMPKFNVHWGAFGCTFYKSGCGDIVGGWFMWALRDAVDHAGYYTSASLASETYGKIRRDISDACEKGLLPCRPRPWLSFFAGLSAEQYEAIPGSVLKVTSRILLMDPGNLVVPPTAISDPTVFQWWWLLNYPRIALGRGHLHNSAPPVTQWASTAFALVTPALAAAGTLCCGWFLIRRRQLRDPLFLLACGAWGLAVARLALLVLIDVSSFPTSFLVYTMPATYLVLIASMLSVALLGRDIFPSTRTFSRLDSSAGNASQEPKG